MPRKATLAPHLSVEQLKDKYRKRVMVSKAEDGICYGRWA